MSKRGAANYMTDQNWEDEEEPEEAGVFKQADQSVLKTRQLKKAKRRNQKDESEEGPGVSVFSGFAGFAKTTDSSSAASKAFSGFGSFGSSKPLSFSNSNGDTATKPSTTGNFTATAKPAEVVVDESSNESRTSTTSAGKSPSKSGSKYLQQLKSLNEGVTKWIKDHVDKNPYCILTPIFKDYEKYHADIEKNARAEEKAGGDAKSTTKPSKVEEAKPTPATAEESIKPSFTSPTATTGPTSETTTTTSTFTFGKIGESQPKPSDKTPEASSSATGGTGLFSSAGFSFGKGPATSVFGSGSSTGGFSFASVPNSGAASAAAADDKTEDDEYVPPKAEVSEVTEDDALYSKRCKLFYKAEDQWKEKGVGNIHLKPCGEKTQLLIRADTSLGNILLNIMLSATMPVSRQGKNNVSLACIPNPPLDPKAKEPATEIVPLLIRVKTAEDADELFDKIKEHKG